ncbi:hypothetical protein GQ472_02015 [archaeon]|nr:hypothetical protein [archaeon]
MAIDNVTVSDLSFKAVSTSFDSLSTFIQTSTQAVSFFVTSLAYWIILITVIAVALGMIYLFFWVYYRGIKAILNIYPIVMQGVDWIDQNLIERLKRMSDGDDEVAEPEPEPVYEDRQQDRPPDRYLRRDEG